MDQKNPHRHDEPAFLGYALGRIESKIDKIIAVGVSVNAKLDRLLQGAPDLSPEAKAAFQVEIDRLTGLAEPTNTSTSTQKD